MSSILNIKQDAEFDVSGMGSALLDLIIEVDDQFLTSIGLTKTHMHLIDADRSGIIRELIESYSMQVAPGGSSANTAAGVANFGGKSVFLGKVGDDANGAVYIAETETAGVKSGLVKDESATGHAITFITTDSERTFATYLGAAIEFSEDDINPDYIINSRILHIEGYMLELPVPQKACFRAMQIAKENNVLISIDLSDPALVGRLGDVLKNAVKDYADIVFANEDEAKAFTGAEEEDALHILSDMCSFAVVKLGAGGSLIKCGGSVYTIPVYETEVVNTNGAGDMYAAGVLYGISHGFDPEKSGKIGSYAASLVVSSTGARVTGNIDIGKI